MKNFFVYGTLLNDEILELLLSFVPEKVSATLFDYQRVQVQGEVYPAILPNAGYSVEGVLLSGLSDLHLKLLDDYEGSHYQRKKVELLLSDGERIFSETYVYNPKYYPYLSKEPWSNEEFRSKYLHQYQSFM